MKTNPVITIANSGFKITNKVWAIPNTYSLTIQSNASGTASSDAMIGTENYSTTLYAMPEEGYRLNSWNVTGGSVTNNVFTFGNADATIEPVFEEQTSALLYQDLEEVISANISKSFTVELNDEFPYIAVEFDWKTGTDGSVLWSYNRDCCGIESHHQRTGGYGTVSGLQPVLNTVNSTSSINSVTIYDNKVFASDTDVTTYSNVKYIWSYNDTGFSAIVDDVWRYKDNRTNSFTSLNNFTVQNGLTQAMFQRTCYLKNLKIGGFNTLEDALSNW